MRRILKAGVVGGLMAMAFAGPAGAATTIGQTVAPNENCGDGYTFLQTATPGGNSYAFPSAGVVTSWSFQANASPPQLRFKVARPAGGNDFTGVASSDLKSPLANQLTTYPTQITVQAGDVIGFYLATPGGCSITEAGYIEHIFFGDIANGTTETFVPGPDEHLDIAANLEADADNDGFGDETQDQCPADATTHGDCTAPETTITVAPTSKTDKRKATFKFISSEAASAFECKLKGKGLKASVKKFGACTSPRKYKHLDLGKYAFQVRAIDPAGNGDPTPDKSKFKVVD
jgi:hypothetical protein